MLQCSCSWYVNETSHSSLHFVLYCTQLSKVNKSATIMWEMFNDSEQFSQITWHTYTSLPSTRINCVDLRHTNNWKPYLNLCNMWPNTATIVRSAVWTVVFVGCRHRPTRFQTCRAVRMLTVVIWALIPCSLVCDCRNQPEHTVPEPRRPQTKFQPSTATYQTS